MFGINTAKEIWNEVAKGYSAVIDGSAQEVAQEIDGVLKKQGIAPGSTLLEMGSGSGHISACLNMAGYKTDLLDFSMKALEKSRELYDKLGLSGRFIDGDIMDIESIKLDMYDLAWNSGVMEHFTDDMITTAFKNMRKVSQNALILVPNPKSISYLLMRYIRQSQDDWRYGTEYLRSDYAVMMKNAGYESCYTFHTGKVWTMHNFRLAMQDAKNTDAYEDMLERGLLPEQEKYLVGYFASSNEKCKSGKNSEKKVLKARALNTEAITKISDLNAERFGLEKKLKIMSGSLDEERGRASWYAAQLDKMQIEHAREKNELENTIDEHSADKKRDQLEFENRMSQMQARLKQAQAEHERILATLQDNLAKERHESESKLVGMQAGYAKKINEQKRELELIIATKEDEKTYFESIIMTMKMTHDKAVAQLSEEVEIARQSHKRRVLELEEKLQTKSKILNEATKIIQKAMEASNELFESKLFKLLHLLRRTGKQLIIGTWTEKRAFFRWLYAHIGRRYYVDRGYNPIHKITDILEQSIYTGYPELEKTKQVRRHLYVYKWATMGGVERVFLSRARAFKEHGVDIKTDVFFFHNSGGLDNFIKYIEHYKLEEYIKVVTSIDEREYDFVFSFDTPEVFEIIKSNAKIIIECHTPYRHMRGYLNNLPEDIAAIVSPSEIFKQEVLSIETDQKFHKRLFVLPNFYVDSETTEKPRKTWKNIPLCYIGRMDELKNTKELLEIFKLLCMENNNYELVLAGNIVANYIDIEDLSGQSGIGRNVHYMGGIPFERVDEILCLIKHHKGIFVSGSTGESFGLSALEAMANGVPVLLSDNSCHKELVNDDDELLYRQGNILQAVKKIENISSRYDELSIRVRKYSNRFDSESFIEHWKNMLSNIPCYRSMEYPKTRNGYSLKHTI